MACNLALAGASCFLFIRHVSQVNSYQPVNQVASAADFSVTVDVQGAVQQPGLVTLAAGLRVGDALAAAGGIADQVDPVVVARQLNLAAHVEDGQKIYVPFVEEAENMPGEEDFRDSQKVIGISVNTATKAELMQLDGIGEKRAETIIENRPYATLDDFYERGGLSENMLASNENTFTL